MEDATSLLTIIHEKEVALRHQLEEARRRAEAMLQAAREEVEQMIAQTDQEARGEAEVLYQRGLAEANQEAEALVATARKQAATLRRQAQARMEDAVQQIVALLLPAGFSLTDESQEEIFHLSDLRRSN
jgi:vacuolar-type H+-ATPase subunit H